MAQISTPFQLSQLSMEKRYLLKKALKALVKNTNNAKRCIAGGFASYIIGYTTSYGDVDLFEENANSPPYTIDYPSKYFNYEGEVFNNISVGYTTGSYEHFVFLILQSFDMNICKVGIYINERNELMLINFPRCIGDLMGANSLSRYNKYSERLERVKFYMPKTLSLCSYIENCKKCVKRRLNI